MTEIKIGGRTIPLFYSSYEMIAIQKEIGCTSFELRDAVFGLHLADEENENSWAIDVADNPEKLMKFGILVRILGNAGLEESGQKGDLTEKWILRHMKPVTINEYAVIIMAEILDGNKVEETTPEEEQGPVDEILEEQNAKKQPGN